MDLRPEQGTQYPVQDTLTLSGPLDSRVRLVYEDAVGAQQERTVHAGTWDLFSTRLLGFRSTTYEDGEQVWGPVQDLSELPLDMEVTVARRQPRSAYR